jgi:hypothetical protein
LPAAQHSQQCNPIDSIRLLVSFNENLIHKSSCPFTIGFFEQSAMPFTIGFFEQSAMKLGLNLPLHISIDPPA